MKRRLIFTLLGLCAAADAAEVPQDLLRFINGDQLHGTFGGVLQGPSVGWKRDDLAKPVEFKTSKIRHVVLRGGRPLKALESLSHIGLINGDRIPGIITAIDPDFVTLETSFAGPLRIKRNQVSMIAPNPLGGRVYFHGPFSASDWKMVHPAFPDGLPPELAIDPAAPAEDPAEDEATAEDAESKTPGRWEFSGSAWYWQQKRGGTALIRESGMPDRSVLRFDVAWKNRLSLAIGFNADFAKPKPGPEDGKADDDDNEDKAAAKARAIERLLNASPGDSNNLPLIFGNSHVLQIYTNYLMLFRTFFYEDGKPGVQRVHLNNNNLRLGDTTRATVELRSNRNTGAITLFINDEFVSQWSDADFAGRGDADEHQWKSGSGFGFLAQGEDMPVRISDIIVSEWNGMPDSARSLEVDDRDVILMANGTDRYAGSAGILNEQGRLLFEGKHGSFQFPLDDIAELRFARDKLAEAPEESAERLLIRFSPVGTISGRPVAADAGNLIHLMHPLVGGINLSTDSAIMLEFNSSNQIIDDWDANF